MPGIAWSVVIWRAVPRCLHEVVPVFNVGFLTNTNDRRESSQRADAEEAARRFNLKLVALNASTEREIDATSALSLRS